MSEIADNLKEMVIGSGELYSSEKHGNDETGDGSSEKPFKTVLQAMRHAGKEPFPTIYVDGKRKERDMKLLQNLH